MRRSAPTSWRARSRQRWRGRRAALLANHGAVAIGNTVAAAVDLAIQLEWLASVTYHAMLAGQPAVLDDAELERVVERSRTLRYVLTEAP
jgi:L-fuculose-phosphate aldolase